MITYNRFLSIRKLLAGWNTPKFVPNCITCKSSTLCSGNWITFHTQNPHIFYIDIADKLDVSNNTKEYVIVLVDGFFQIRISAL